MLEITSEKVKEITIVRPAGKIDERSSKEFHDHVGRLLDEGVRWIVIDFSRTVSIVGSTLRVLLMLKAKATFPDGGLILCGVDNAVKRAFEVARITRRFATTQLEGEAVDLLVKEREMKQLSDTAADLLAVAEMRGNAQC
jgi:anti-anti-sigma factor